MNQGTRNNEHIFPYDIKLLGTKLNIHNHTHTHSPWPFSPVISVRIKINMPVAKKILDQKQIYLNDILINHLFITSMNM